MIQFNRLELLLSIVRCFKRKIMQDKFFDVGPARSVRGVCCSYEGEVAAPKIPTSSQLRLVTINNAVPFIGFGFLDNFIMIIAGDYIDSQIGVALGISTMAAAGLGNLISDFAGIGASHCIWSAAWPMGGMWGLAGYVEAFATRLGIATPDLTIEQLELPSTRWATSVGRGFGIVIGCILGMCPLLFLDTKRDADTE